jgi:tRNA (guanine-N7-)-methyltransferase
VQIDDTALESEPYAQSGRPSTGRDSRTFKARRGRLTLSEQEAVDQWRSVYEYVPTAAEMLPFDPLVIDIGFGNGETTLALAREFWAATIVGIDVHTPGFGALLRILHDQSITNVRICDTDALDVLRWSVRDHSVTLVNVAFPDPWPKVGQQHRRLVQVSFLDVLATKLRVGGTFRFASDWLPYAEQVEELFAADARFEQAPPWHDRPKTKFENRGIAEGRPITDLAYLLR